MKLCDFGFKEDDVYWDCVRRAKHDGKHSDAPLEDDGPHILHDANTICYLPDGTGYRDLRFDNAGYAHCFVCLNYGVAVL
jgi:hypothetical protein